MKKRLLTSVFLIMSLVLCFFMSCDKEDDDAIITLRGGDPGVDPLTQTSSLSGGTVFSTNSGGNKPLSGSPFGYEMWTEGGNNNKLTWYGANRGGGAAFRADWNNPNDFLGRVGWFLEPGGKYTSYGNLFCGFNYKRSANNTAGGYSYIGIYGWSRSPLVEYYIVEDWFGNASNMDETKPMTTATTGGSVKGTFTVDGSVYNIIQNTRVNKPSINGNATFEQFFSVLQTPRKAGTISITEHFKQWESLGMKLGNLYECKFLVEAGGGIGWFDASYITFYQKKD